MGDIPRHIPQSHFRPYEQYQIIRYGRRNEPRANEIMKKYGNIQEFRRKGRGLFSFSLPSFSMPSWKSMLGGAALGYAGYKGAKAGANWVVPNLKRQAAAAKDWFKGLNPMKTTPKNQEQVNQTAKPGRQAFKTSENSLYHEPTTLYMDNVVTNGPAIDKTNTRTVVPELKSTMYKDSQRKQKRDLNDILKKLPKTDETKKHLIAIGYDKNKKQIQGYEANKYNTNTSKGTLMEVQGNNPELHGDDLFYDANGRSKKTYRLQATFHGSPNFKNQRMKPY